MRRKKNIQKLHLIKKKLRSQKIIIILIILLKSNKVAGISLNKKTNKSLKLKCFINIL